MAPPFKVSTESELSALRNRDLDASLKELDHAFRREKERQDRLVKIQRIQKFQRSIILHQQKSSQLQSEIDNPSSSKKVAPQGKAASTPADTRDDSDESGKEEEDDDDEDEEEEEEDEDDSQESDDSQEEPVRKKARRVPSSSASESSYRPLLEESTATTTVEPVERDDEVVVPLVFNNKALEILAPLQKSFLEKCYPTLSFQESVPGIVQDQDLGFMVEPGVSTDDQGSISTADIPAAPIHASVLKKAKEISYRMRAKEPKGAQVTFKPPTKARLANLVKPDATVRRVVTMKKSLAEKLQCDLSLDSAEGVYYKDLARWKQSQFLNPHSDSNKLSSAKFQNLGSIMGAANWIQILNDFILRTLKDDTPDMAAVFHALELQSKLNVHGVVDGVSKLQATSLWEKRTELLQAANLPANLATKLCALRPVGPGPFQGQLLTLARQAATERKESQDLRGITETSQVLAAVRGLKGIGGNTSFTKKNKGAKSFSKNKQKKKFKKQLFVKQQQGDRRTVSFDSQPGGFTRPKTPKGATKDQTRKPFQKYKKGGDSGQQL
jgi:hypothetical protein